MTALKSLEARVSGDDLELLRKIAAREQERAMLGVRFALLVERYRAENPASISPHWGIA